MNVDDRTALELLRVFARLEFALKQFPEFVRGEPGQNAQTQWSAFNVHLRKDSFITRISPDSRAVLLGNPVDGPPPMKMFVDEKRRIRFEDQPLEGNHVADHLMDATRRVRNNLVHGGKEGPDERSPGHDQRCVVAAIDVMRSAMHEHQGVSELCPWRLACSSSTTNIDDPPTVRCRRRPGHRRCTGVVMSYPNNDENDTIYWYCPACGDNGFISGWQNTLWDGFADPLTSHRDQICLSADKDTLC
jgi:hypothetical protein